MGLIARMEKQICKKISSEKKLPIMNFVCGLEFEPNQFRNLASCVLIFSWKLFDRPGVQSSTVFDK